MRAALVAAIVLLAGTAHAQASPNAVVAEQLFREGEQAFAAGRVHEACEKFAASNKLDPAPGTLNNLAVCHEKEGKTASAWLEFGELAALAQHAGKKDRERAARERAATLEKSLARVQIAAPEGARLTSIAYDGAALDPAAIGTAFPVDPGEHTFDFTDDKGRRATTKLVVRPGPGLTSVTPAFPAPEEPARPKPSPPSAPKEAPREPARAGDGARTASFVLFGAGAIGIGVGAVFGVLANAHRDDHPNDNAFTYAEVSTIAFGVGLAAAAVGAVLFVATPKRSAFYLAPRVAGVEVGGRF
jgi:hypothetical protein